MTTSAPPFMNPRLWSAIGAFLAVSLGTPLPAAEREIARSSLAGVWEVIACQSPYPRSAGSPRNTLNFKYCFSPDQAYPMLSPDAAGDSADGGGSYYLVGGNILVIRTGVPGGIWTYEIGSVSHDKMIWQQGSLRFTLRRIAKV